MKYQDYYKILGVERDADIDAIKKAYRKLAHQYHPDVSKDPAGEEKFKQIADAYQTLKDPEKRAAYDQLGRHQAGQEFQPPPDWGKQFGGGSFSAEDLDLSELFAGLAGGRGRAGRQGGAFKMPGQDYEVTAHITRRVARTRSLRRACADQFAEEKTPRIDAIRRCKCSQAVQACCALRLVWRRFRRFSDSNAGDEASNYSTN